MNEHNFNNIGKNINQDECRRYRLGIGEYTIVEPPDIITSHGIGSCLIIILYDPGSAVGIGVHTLLPSDNSLHTSQDEKGKYTDEAIELIYAELESHPDVVPDNIIAKITGGSEVLRYLDMASNVGKMNITEARNTLETLGIRIAAEDTGGDYGRIIEFDPSTGGLTIRKSNGEQKVI